MPDAAPGVMKSIVEWDATLVGGLGPAPGAESDVVSVAAPFVECGAELEWNYAWHRGRSRVRRRMWCPVLHRVWSGVNLLVTKVEIAQT